MTAIKKFAIMTTAIVVAVTGPAWAQKRFEIGGSYGYQFGGLIHAQEGDLRFSNGANFGVTFDLAIRPNAWVEVSYSRQDTSVDFLPAAGGRTPLFDAGVEYYQLGGLYETGGRVSPFALATIGLVNVNPKAAEIETETQFAAALGGGLKIYLARRLGLRLQGRLLIPFLSSEGAILVGPGGGYAVVSSNVLVWGDLSAGLFFRF